MVSGSWAHITHSYPSLEAPVFVANVQDYLLVCGQKLCWKRKVWLEPGELWQLVGSRIHQTWSLENYASAAKMKDGLWIIDGSKTA